MGKIYKFVIAVFLVLIAINTLKAHALEQEYETTGQASFYGSYKYEKETDDGSNNSGTRNYLSTGQAVLPKTGDYINPIYVQVGIAVIASTIGLIFIEKRKKEYRLWERHLRYFLQLRY